MTAFEKLLNRLNIATDAPIQAIAARALAVIAELEARIEKTK